MQGPLYQWLIQLGVPAVVATAVVMVLQSFVKGE